MIAGWKRSDTAPECFVFFLTVICYSNSVLFLRAGQLRMTTCDSGCWPPSTIASCIQFGYFQETRTVVTGFAIKAGRKFPRTGDSKNKFSSTRKPKCHPLRVLPRFFFFLPFFFRTARNSARCIFAAKTMARFWEEWGRRSLRSTAVTPPCSGRPPPRK